MTTPSQLTLAVALKDDAQFENFYCGEANRQLLTALKNPDQQNAFVYISGRKSSGKTHLLQALCHQADSKGQSSFYFSLQDLHDVNPEILSAIDEKSRVCIDDFEKIGELQTFEAGFFTLFNRLLEAGGQLIIAAECAPTSLNIHLDDLHSRLQSMLIYRLYGLDDEEKKLALQLRAKKRGFLLGDSVVDFILLRAGRDLVELMTVLDKLDNETLEQKRLLSIPLVKETLGW